MNHQLGELKRMIGSFREADRGTHLKVVLVGIGTPLLVFAGIWWQTSELQNTLEANRGHEEVVRVSSAKLPD